jgi:hypothetical protein
MAGSCRLCRSSVHPLGPIIRWDPWSPLPAFTRRFTAAHHAAARVRDSGLSVSARRKFIRPSDIAIGLLPVLTVRQKPFSRPSFVNLTHRHPSSAARTA